MQVVILAGGLGSRLSEETKIVPKALVKIGKKPIIVHLMNYYQSYGYNDFPGSPTIGWGESPRGAK